MDVAHVYASKVVQLLSCFCKNYDRSLTVGHGWNIRQYQKGRKTYFYFHEKRSSHSTCQNVLCISIITTIIVLLCMHTFFPSLPQAFNLMQNEVAMKQINWVTTCAILRHGYSDCQPTDKLSQGWKFHRFCKSKHIIWRIDIYLRKFVIGQAR